jgi:hypothetical protein
MEPLKMISPLVNVPCQGRCFGHARKLIETGERRVDVAALHSEVQLASGAEDLLRHLYELSQAMVNDFERFREAVEDPPIRLRV